MSHRNKLDFEIRKERKMLEAVTRSIGAGSIIINEDYHILWANDLIRRTKGEVDGKLCYLVFNTLHRPCPDCGVTKIFAGKTDKDSHEYFSTTVDGRPCWADIIATPIKDKDGNIVAASELALDITEKKQREKNLKVSQQMFKALFESNPEAVAYTDEYDNLVDANPKFSEIFGYSTDEVKGKNLVDILVPDSLKQEEREQVKKSLTEAVSFESKRKCKTGSLLSVFISVAPVLVGDRRIGSVSVYKDISEVVAAEQKIEAALKRSEILNEKLNVIGSFTRHDVRNKVAAINGNVYLAKKRAGDNIQIQNYLSQIKLASDSVTRILEFAKNYESLGREERAYINLGKAFGEAILLFSDLKDVKINNSCKDFEIFADSMLTIIFHNLIDNSLKYGEHITQISLAAQKEQDGSQTITYEDDGIGIDNETKKQLFAKGFGKGTGYGLYLIRKTCDFYGWTVKETGEPGKGVRFEFNIPPNQQLEENREQKSNFV